MVANGEGVTLLPELAVPSEARRADIVTRRFEEPAPDRTIVLAWRRQSPLADVLEKLAEAMREAWPARPRLPSRR